MGRLISNDTLPCLVSDFTGYFRPVGTASGPPFYGPGTYTQDLTTTESNTYLKIPSIYNNKFVSYTDSEISFNTSSSISLYPQLTDKTMKSSYNELGHYCEDVSNIYLGCGMNGRVLQMYFTNVDITVTMYYIE